MKNEYKEFFKFLGWIIFGSLILLALLFFPNKTIIDSNQTTITVQKQSLYQKWCCGNEYEILKYKQDVNYVGKIISVDKGSHFVGIVGKGGHRVTHYDVIVKYGDNQTIKHRFSKSGYKKLTSKPIVVREKYYPYYSVEIL